MDNNCLSDNEIVELLKDPNTIEAAFRQMFKKYSNRLYFIIRRLVLLHTDASDILQDTFINASKNISQYDGNVQLFDWLCRSAVDKTLFYIGGKNQTYSFAIASYEEECVEKLSSDEFFEGDESQMKLQKLIASLPVRQRVVLVLKCFADMDFEEMSIVLNVSSETLMSMFYEVQQKIGDCIFTSDCFKVPEGYFDKAENAIVEKLSSPTDKRRIDVLKPYIYLAVFIAALYGIVRMYVYLAS